MHATVSIIMDFSKAVAWLCGEFCVVTHGHRVVMILR